MRLKIKQQASNKKWIGLTIKDSTYQTLNNGKRVPTAACMLRKIMKI